MLEFNEFQVPHLKINLPNVGGRIQLHPRAWLRKHPTHPRSTPTSLGYNSQRESSINFFNCCLGLNNNLSSSNGEMAIWIRPIVSNKTKPNLQNHERILSKYTKKHFQHRNHQNHIKIKSKSHQHQHQIKVTFKSTSNHLSFPIDFVRFCVATELRLFFQLRGLQCPTLAHRFPQSLQLREEVQAIHSKCLRNGFASIKGYGLWAD